MARVLIQFETDNAAFHNKEECSWAKQRKKCNCCNEFELQRVLNASAEHAFILAMQSGKLPFRKDIVDENGNAIGTITIRNTNT